MSFTYNGIVFKDPPGIDMAAHPYIFMALGLPSSGYKYLLTLSTEKYYYRASDDTLQPGGNARNYWLTETMTQSGADWEYRDATPYSYSSPSTRICLANYNIPVGSSSGTTYLFEKNFNIPEFPTLMRKTQSSTNGSKSCSATLSGCEVGNLLVAAYAVREKNNEITLTSGWEMLGGGNYASDPNDLYQRIFFASKIAESASEALTVTQTGTNRIYIVAAEFSGASVAEIRNGVANREEGNNVSTQKPSETSVMFYAVTSTFYGSGRNQRVLPEDLIKVEGDYSQERLACWYDYGGGAQTHTFRPDSSGGASDSVVEAVELLAAKTKYKTAGHADYLVTGTEQVHSSADSYIEWTFEAPEGTACEVLVKIGDGDFLAAENGGKIPGLADGTDLTSTPMTVRVALSTENPEVTPVFHSLSLWIADEYDTNVISLHFPEGNQNSVQNAAAPITVAYNGATLAGDGGFVQAFELDCPIDGLEYKGDQNDAEHIDVKSIRAIGELKRVSYKDYSNGAEHINLASITATGTLTHVNDI